MGGILALITTLNWQLSLVLINLNNPNKRWAAEVPKGREAAEQVAKEAGCTLDEGEIIPGTVR